MNPILFITIIVLVMLFSFSIIMFEIKQRNNNDNKNKDTNLELFETFIPEPSPAKSIGTPLETSHKGIKNDTYYDIGIEPQHPKHTKQEGTNAKIDYLAEFEDVEQQKYNQLKEFIPDKDNYTIFKDSGIMIDIDKPIKLGSIEFKNLTKRLDFYRKQELKSRTNPQIRNIKRNLILKQSQEDNSKYPIVRKEVSLLKMDSIITELLRTYQFNEIKFKTRTGTDSKIILDRGHDLKTNPESLESYRFIKNWILEVISNESLKDLYTIKYVNSDRFKFKHDKIIHYHIDYKNNLERFEFQGILYRENKEHNFFIYFDIIFDYKYIKYYVNQVIILGINTEQHIVFADFLDKDYNLDSQGKHLSLSNENPSYVTDNYIKNYRDTTADYVNAQEKRFKEKNKEVSENGYCFYKDAPDKNTCISHTVEGGVGIWDSPCKYNEECPFYKKNLNYPNSRGGCINGYCEMPVNVSLLGYKEYNEGHKPNAICYNCKPIEGCVGIECSQCCEQQKDERHYPNLKSPDYAFDNDYFERIKYSQDFEEKDMAPVKIVI